MPALFAKLIGDEPGYCGRIRLVCGADPSCSSLDSREHNIEGMLNHHGIRCQLRNRLRVTLGARDKSRIASHQLREAAGQVDGIMTDRESAKIKLSPQRGVQ